MCKQGVKVIYTSGVSGQTIGTVVIGPRGNSFLNVTEKFRHNIRAQLIAKDQLTPKLRMSLTQK